MGQIIETKEKEQFQWDLLTQRKERATERTCAAKAWDWN